MTQCRTRIEDLVPSITNYCGVMFVVIDHGEETGVDYVSGLDQDQVMVVSASYVDGTVVVINRHGRTVYTSNHISNVIDYFARVS